MEISSATSRQPSPPLLNKIVNTNLWLKRLRFNPPPLVAQLHKQLAQVKEMPPSLVMMIPLPPLQASSVLSKNLSLLSVGYSRTTEIRAHLLLRNDPSIPQQLPNLVSRPLVSHPMSTNLPAQVTKVADPAMSARLHLGIRLVEPRRI